MTKNKIFNLFLLALFLIFICSNIVIATTFTSSVTPNTVNASTTSQTLNFTLNNTGTDDVVQLNITIPAGFSFISNSNTTTASDNTFSGTSNLVIWDNTTAGGFVANVTIEYFSIDVSVPSVVSGTPYNFTLTTLDNAGTPSVVSVDVTVTVNDVTVPTYQNDYVDNTGAGTPTDFSLYWSDNVGLSGYVFSTNNTGTWANDSFASMSGSTAWSNVTKTLNNTIGFVVGWRVYSNDTSNNWNVTTIFTLTTTDAVLPTYSNIHSDVTNNTYLNLGTVIYLGAQWTDANLSQYMNTSATNSSTFVNGTWAAFGVGNWSNFTLSYPSSSAGGNYSVKIYGKDASGNENVISVWIWYNTTPEGEAFSPGGGYDTTIPVKLVKRAKGNVNITIPSIKSGEIESAFILPTEDVAFRKIIVSAKNTINNIIIIVKKAPGLPSSIASDISTKVYHYIEVIKENFTDADLNNVTVEFTVSKSWLNQNSVDKSNILLYRWENNQWKGLPTRIISETIPDVFYSAVSSGFSYFLIGEAGGETIAAPTCTESWNCMDWSGCVDGLQTRICTDENNCGTTNNKPTESKNCLIEQILTGAQDMGLTGVVVTSVIIIVIVVIIALVLKKGKLNLKFLKKKKKFRYKYKTKPKN